MLMALSWTPSACTNLKTGSPGIQTDSSTGRSQCSVWPVHQGMLQMLACKHTAGNLSYLKRMAHILVLADGCRALYITYGSIDLTCCSSS